MEFIVDKLSNSSLASTNCVYMKNKVSDYITIKHNGKSVLVKVQEDLTIKNSNTICLNTFQRIFFSVELSSKIQIYVQPNTNSNIINSVNSVTMVVKNISTKNPLLKINDDLLEEIKMALLDIPVHNEFQLIFNNKLTLIPMEISNGDTNKLIGPNTELKLISTDKNIDIEVTASQELFKANFNFLEMGVGGLDKQFEVIFRRAFSSRLIPEKILKNLGINHVRGLMLFGPPGTGKTLIARQIGKILNCEEPKIVSGPSLLSSYQGQSEKNVRDLFEEAFADKKGKKLHLVILDEFDAIAKKRGTIHDSGMSDRLVNQFLSMIDGPESLNNILLIAMTNRLELIDDALLRPGRFEVQIEISLPDEKGRLDILKIHTKKMNDSGLLQNVNLNEIATIAKNFTGAELESVVKNAVSYSIAKEIDPNNLASIKDINPVITQVEMLKSVNEIKPQFGTVSKEIEIITSGLFELYSDDYSYTYTNILEKIGNLTNGKLLSILIQGDHYVGKTTLACQIARNCGLNCIKFINTETLMNHPFKDTLLYEIFTQGYKSESFVLILDSVEKLIEYSKLGNVYNNKVLQTIYTIITKIIELNKKVVILLTSSNDILMDTLELNTYCTYNYMYK